MGKKDPSKKRKRDDLEGDGDSDNIFERDPELEAEMAAVKAIRAEKEGITSSSAENYNKDALNQCLADIETNALPFIQIMEISEFEFPMTNELDDMEREMNFYNHALTAVKAGQNMLESLGLPIHRPHDFFCEHMKSDAHMARIKDRLIMEEKRIEAFEQRKNREQSKKFNKQLSLIKKTEKTKETRNFNKEIEHVKKSKDGNKDEKLERILNSDRHGDRDRTEKSKKRKIMDKKYGFGGKDGKKSKMNDSKSLNDFTDFNPRGGKAVRSSVPRRTKGGKGANRPGKAARAKSRGGKR